jgi:hypothetical protein
MGLADSCEVYIPLGLEMNGEALSRRADITIYAADTHALRLPRRTGSWGYTPHGSMTWRLIRPVIAFSDATIG